MYIAVLRGTLALLLLLHYGVFAWAGLKLVMVAVITFALNTTAYVAGLSALPQIRGDIPYEERR